MHIHIVHALKRVNQSIIEIYKHSNNSTLNLARAKELSLRRERLIWATNHSLRQA